MQLSLSGRLLVLKHIMMALPVYLASILHFSDSDWGKLEKTFREYLWRFAGKPGWIFCSWTQICTPREQGGWGVPNLHQRSQKLLSKWIEKLESPQPWAIIAREKIKQATIHGSQWENTHWTSKLMGDGNLKLKHAQFLQKLVNS